eukprot:gene5369-5757_t
MNQTNNNYYTFRRFPELCQSFKQAETLGRTQEQQKRRPRTTEVAERLGGSDSLQYRSYQLHRKMKDLKALSSSENETLERSWSSVRLQQRQKSAVRTSRLSPQQTTETFSPLEIALRKLNKSGYPGIEEQDRSFTLNVAGLFATLQMKTTDTADTLRIQLLRVLGVPLLDEEVIELHKFLLSQIR